MFALLNSLGTSYKPSSESTIDAFWKTLLGNYHVKDTTASEAVWRARFDQWFAFILLTVRSNLKEEKDKYDKPWEPRTRKSKWFVPLLADWPALEKRVAEFLDFHEPQLEAEGGATVSTLRRTIATLAKRVWGTETIEDLGSWSKGMSDILSAVRGEEFYEPISVFEQRFETFYDGRRIFVTEGGYLGTGAEDVRAGDVVVLVAGADVPYVLRPVVGKEKTCTLVSEAYVHGIMKDGAGLKAAGDFEPITLI
jgi:hypothetical protein